MIKLWKISCLIVGIFLVGCGKSADESLNLAPSTLAVPERVDVTVDLQIPRPVYASLKTERGHRRLFLKYGSRILAQTDISKELLSKLQLKGAEFLSPVLSNCSLSHADFSFQAGLLDISLGGEDELNRDDCDVFFKELLASGFLVRFRNVRLQIDRTEFAQVGLVLIGGGGNPPR